MADSDVITSVAVLAAGFMALEGLWLAYLTRAMRRERQFKAEEKAEEAAAEKRTLIEDLFLLHRSGILLKHYTRRLRPTVDSDLLSGMLVAVQEFIKDTFREEKGHVNEIRFGEMRLVIVEGKWTILSGVIRGERPMDILPQMQVAMSEMETKYEDPLLKWSGDMDELPEIESIMNDLLAGKFKGRKPTVHARPAPIPIPSSKG